MEDHRKTILQLFDLAESVREELAIRYDHDGVAFISNFIERQRDNFSLEDSIGLINALGAFVGQAIIENYGGEWVYEDDFGQYGIAFDEKNRVYPIGKVKKQFENGSDDSVFSMYKTIPIVFKITPPKKKKWWQF